MFKLNQKVYWGQLEGEVIKICNGDIYPISVEFSNGEADYFTTDGRFQLGFPPVLSFTPYTLDGFSQEEKIEQGTIVYFRDDESKLWNIGYYDTFKDGRHHVFYNQQKSGKSNSFKFVTTENPLVNK